MYNDLGRCFRKQTISSRVFFLNFYLPSILIFIVPLWLHFHLHSQSILDYQRRWYMNWWENGGIRSGTEISLILSNNCLIQNITIYYLKRSKVFMRLWFLTFFFEEYKNYISLLCCLFLFVDIPYQHQISHSMSLLVITNIFQLSIPICDVWRYKRITTLCIHHTIKVCRGSSSDTTANKINPYYLIG